MFQGRTRSLKYAENTECLFVDICVPVSEQNSSSVSLLSFIAHVRNGISIFCRNKYRVGCRRKGSSGRANKLRTLPRGNHEALWRLPHTLLLLEGVLEGGVAKAQGRVQAVSTCSTDGSRDGCNAQGPEPLRDTLPREAFCAQHFVSERRRVLRVDEGQDGSETEDAVPPRALQLGSRHPRAERLQG